MAPDARRLLFPLSPRRGGNIYSRAADGTGEVERLTTRADEACASRDVLVGSRPSGIPSSSPAARRTRRDQQGRIDPIDFEQPRRLGHDIALKSTGSDDRAHEGQVADVQTADATTIHELPQAVDGERQVGVGRQALLIEGFAAVVLAELGNIDITGYDAEGGVASPRRRVEGCIVGPDEAGTGYQAESALGERLRKKGPGNGVDAPPPVGFEEKPNGEREL